MRKTYIIPAFDVVRHPGKNTLLTTSTPANIWDDEDDVAEGDIWKDGDLWKGEFD